MILTYAAEKGAQQAGWSPGGKPVQHCSETSRRHMEEEAESDNAGDISEQVFDRGKLIFVVNVRPLADSIALI